MNNLYQAHNQWSSRPVDQRFESLEEMYTVSRGYYDTARTATIPYRQIECADDGGELVIAGNERVARLTHWSFGQLANRIGAPSSYLRSLPASMASDCVNHGLQTIGNKDDKATILFHENGSLLARAFTSDEYSRIWNWEIIDRLRGLDSSGWRVPVARPAHENSPGARRATESDITARTLNLRVGDWIAPAGLYASDHDMFAFLVNEDCVIQDGTDDGLARGVFVSNSEVGASALKVTRFLYRHVCGNHIVWDVSDVNELRIIHRGNAAYRYQSQFLAELRSYASESPAGEQQRIADTKRMLIASTKDELLDTLFGKKLLSRKTLELCYDHAESQATDFSPKSVWGMVQGITSYSQHEAFGEKRVELDRAAGRLLQMNF